MKKYKSFISKWKINYVNELDKEEIGHILRPFEIFEYITSFHTIIDYDDTDIYEKCEKYDYFILDYININKLDLNEFLLDSYKINKYIKMYKKIKKYPPIVINEDYTIIDGLHRVNALYELGLKKIKAYIGKKE